MPQRTAYAFPVIIDPESSTATAAAGAATLNLLAGKITSEAITTAAGSDYVLTLTNANIVAADHVFVSVANGTNTTEGIAVNRVQPAAGSCVIRIRNTHASSALNGTIVIAYYVVKV
jgi:hypothetical protein